MDFQEAFDCFRRILIVDDETDVRLNLRMTLETAGYEIYESCSGELLKDHEKAKKCYAYAINVDKHYEPARQNMASA